MTYELKYQAVLPDIPGVDLLHPTRESAEREVKNALKAGACCNGYVREVMVRPRQRVA